MIHLDGALDKERGMQAQYFANGGKKARVRIMD